MDPVVTDVTVPIDTGAFTGGLHMQILGPLRIWRDGAELDAGPRQQAFLLAVLLARVGRPTSTAELVDLIWGEGAPASALNVLHKYIGVLRRLLDPTLPARGTGTYLVRRGSGYLFTADAGESDLVGFRRLVAAAEAAVTEQHRGIALDRYEDALALWAGPAGDGLDAGPRAMPIFAGVNDEYLDACTAAADLAVALGRPERLLAPLHLAATIAPLNEAVQASLVTLLGAAGRQAEALAVFQRVRARLADELGLDPGQALRTAHQRVLSQRVTSPPTDPPASPTADNAAGNALLGRAEELAVLRRSIKPLPAGGTALVIIEGEPGSGKTRVLEEISAEVARLGATVVWGCCLQGDGAPSMWPWMQVVGALVDALRTERRHEWLSTDLGRLVEPRVGLQAGSVLPDSGGQFRLFEQVVAIVAEVAAHGPLVLVIDDLHWADVASLQLFTHLTARLPNGTIVLGALRDRAPAPGTELARMLAAASRVAGHRRIVLRPLDQDAVAELVRREIGQRPDDAVTRSIHARTGGNPFFVRELSRFLADGGELSRRAAARTGVPSTVRDVVRDRLSLLDGNSEALLHISALIGREVGLGLLAGVAGLDVQTCLSRLEPLQSMGLLEPIPADPYSFRFSHDLIRESVAGLIPRRLTTELHVRIADALEQSNFGDDSTAERLAYHLWSAGPLADPARTATGLIRAGSHAATKSALEAAEHQLRSAVELARAAGLDELELSALSQLTAVVGMRSMYGTASLALLERAEHLSRTLGREVEAAGFLFSRWTAHGQAIELDRSGPLARRLLDQGYASADPMVRMYGLQAWGIHQYHIGNVGEAHRYVSQTEQTLLAGIARRDENPVQADLMLLMTGMTAEITAVHGDVDAARRLLGVLESVADDNPYRVTVWATLVARTASVLGDAQWALRATERGIAVDPSFSFVFLGTYQRLASCWAMAVTGAPDRAAAAAAEAQRIIAANLLDPPRSCVATWYALLGEMHLAAGSTADAATALDRARFYLDTYGQLYPEGLMLLVRARLLQARGEPAAVVRAAAESARTVSGERESRLFARRAQDFLDGLG